MTDDEQLDHLIGVLYETALDPSRWKEAIGLCGQYTRGVDAQLLTMSKKDGYSGFSDIGRNLFSESRECRLC
jgi:hypothetical protein